MLFVLAVGAMFVDCESTRWALKRQILLILPQGHRDSECFLQTESECRLQQKGMTCLERQVRPDQKKSERASDQRDRSKSRQPPNMRLQSKQPGNTHQQKRRSDTVKRAQHMVVETGSRMKHAGVSQGHDAMKVRSEDRKWNVPSVPLCWLRRGQTVVNARSGIAASSWCDGGRIRAQRKRRWLKRV